MSEPAPSPSPAPAPSPAPSPAPAPSPSPGPAAQRPDWLPEAHWDAKAGIKPEFGAHYSELSTFHKTQTETQAALKARKPEDIKVEVKLPDTVKVPEGMELKIDEKDPRVPVLRKLALDHGLPQDTVNALVAFDAQMQIEAHAAEVARVAEQDKTLGQNAKDRKGAVAAWFKGLKDGGKISAEEFAEANELATFAHSVTLFEKLQAMLAGTVPGQGGGPPSPPKPADVPMEQRWYPPSSQKAS